MLDYVSGMCISITKQRLSALENIHSNEVLQIQS